MNYIKSDCLTYEYRKYMRNGGVFMININRVMRDITIVGEIGRNDGQGITRVAFSDEYNQATKILINLMEETGLDVKVDPVGNVIGLKKGLDNSLPSIILGSHLDTVVNGGLYDGLLGIVSGLEFIRAINENNYVNIHPIEVIAFNAEEGSEMGGTFGSRAMLGQINLEDDNLINKAKIYNLGKQDLINSIRYPGAIKCFIELHIEQGGILDNNDISIGIVNGIAGITRYKITIQGESNHAGTTPMNLRKDALIEACKVILKSEEIVRSIGGSIVSNIGIVKIFPGAVNVIPGKVELILELRDLEQKEIGKAINIIINENIPNEGYKIDFLEITKKEPIKLDSNIIRIIEDCCISNNIKYMIMPSGAGHDAKEFAQFVPSGMIFVKSKNGVSHCPEEFSEINDIEIGIKILYETIIALDKRDIMI